MIEHPISLAECDTDGKSDADGGIEQVDGCEHRIGFGAPSFLSSF